MDSITEARDQLQGALQAAGSRKRNSEWDSSDEDNLIDIQDVVTPSRGRKKRPKPTPSAAFHDTYVMKLFDRSVNLAQFAANAPLYPVCRAWMTNDPDTVYTPPPKKDLLRQDETEPQTGLVFHMPRPLYAPLEESGHPADLRIPAGLSPPDPACLEELQPCKDDPSAPLKSDLLKEHLAWWRKVRKQWHKAAARNEQRYAESFAVLKSICVPDS